MINGVFWALAGVVLVTTALPLTNSAVWWIRMWDFPRLHIAMLALLLLLTALPLAISYKGSFYSLLAAAFVYQAALIVPYAPFYPVEIAQKPAPSADQEISMLAINVLMENTRHSDLIEIVQREDPDILLLMETDTVWDEAVKGLLAEYQTVKKHVADTHYGLTFATRLPAISVELLWPEDDNTPALRAILRAPGGGLFNFVGLHPRPPVPGNDTQTRDKQIKAAARMTASTDRPTVVMGDFNDVAWSWTSRRFKRYGNFVEPRKGRGMIASFHVDYPLLRFPIDQLYLTPDVNLVSFERLEAFGSDHFPMKATVFIDPESRPKDE